MKCSRRLFDRVVVPASVQAELQHANTPTAVRQWMSALPTWTEVRRATASDLAVRLGAGETEAIALALELKAAAILVDDDKARKFALGKGLAALGTLAVLEKAAELLPATKNYWPGKEYLAWHRHRHGFSISA